MKNPAEYNLSDAYSELDDMAEWALTHPVINRNIAKPEAISAEGEHKEIVE